MASSQYWLKRNHTAFHEQVNSTWNYIDPTKSTKLESFGYVAGSPVLAWINNSFAPALKLFNSAYDAWEDASERTRAKQIVLEDAEQVLKPLYRNLYAMFKGNPLVTNDDLDHMAMPVRRAWGRIPHSAPKTRPRGEAEPEGPGVIRIHFFDEGTSRGKAKPHGVHGVEMCWAILDRPPTTRDELVNNASDTRSPLDLTFDLNERGKQIYFSLRWENTTGAKGNWSEIYTTIIP